MTTVGQVFQQVAESGYKLSWLLTVQNDTDDVPPSMENPNHRIGWVTDVETSAHAKQHMYCKLNIMQLNGDETPCIVKRLRATSLLFQKFSPIRVGVFLTRERNTQTVWNLESAVVYVDAAAVDKLLRAGKTIFNTLLASSIFVYFITVPPQCVFIQELFWKNTLGGIRAKNVEEDKRLRRRFAFGNKTSYSLRNNIIRLTKHTAVDIEKGVPMSFKNVSTVSRLLQTGVLLNVPRTFDYKGLVQLVLRTCKSIDATARLQGGCETALFIVPKLGIPDFVKVLENMDASISVTVLETADDLFRTTAQSLRNDQNVVLVTYELLCSRQYTSFVKLATCSALQAQLRSTRINKPRWIMNQMLKTTGPEMSSALRLQNVLSEDWGAAVTLASARRMFLPENTFNASLCVPLELLTFGAIVMLDVQHCFVHTQYKSLCESLSNLHAVHKWAATAGGITQISAQSLLWSVLLRLYDVPRSQACMVLQQIALEAAFNRDAAVDAVVTVHDKTRVPVWDTLDWEDFNVTSDVARSFYLQTDIPKNVCIGTQEQLVKRAVFEQEISFIRQCFTAAQKAMSARGHASIQLGSGHTMQTAHWDGSFGPVYSSPIVSSWLVTALEGARTVIGFESSPHSASSDFEFLGAVMDSDSGEDDIQYHDALLDGIQALNESKSTENSCDGDMKETEDSAATTVPTISTLSDEVKANHTRQQLSAVKRNKDTWKSLMGVGTDIPDCPVCACDPCNVMLKCGHVLCYACGIMSVRTRRSCATCQCKLNDPPLLLIVDQPHAVSAPDWLPETLQVKWHERVCSSPLSALHWTSAQFWMWYHLNANLQCIVIVNTDKNIALITKLSRSMLDELSKPVRRLTPFSLKQYQNNKTNLILSKRTLMSGTCPPAQVVLVLCALNDVEVSILQTAVPGATVRYCMYTIETEE